MALKTKTDYFNLSANGWQIASTNENRSVNTAEANGSDGFTIAVSAFGERIAPSCDYIATTEASVTGIKLGQVFTVDGKSIALANISVTTSAGNAPTLSASGQQIENDGVAHCTATIPTVTISSLFHAQTGGLFTVSGGQLTDSTITFEGNVGLAEVDGEIKSSDLVGGRITISGTIVGVTSAGALSVPTVTCSDSKAVITQPVSESNPNGDYPTYSFGITIPLAAD